MSTATLLLIVALLQQGFIALAWLAAAFGGLSRTAAAHWCAAAVCTGASLAIASLRGQVDPWVGFGVANALGVLSAVLIRRGGQIFIDKAGGDREHGLVLGCALLALVGLLAFREGPRAGVVFVTAVAVAWCLLRSAVELWQRLRFELGLREATLLAAPIVLVGSAFTVRALLAPLSSGLSVPLGTPGLAEGYFGLFLLASTLLLHFSLGGMTVMRLVRRFEHLSLHDALTGVLNRRGIERRIEAESQRLARYGTPYALLAIDLDHFKRVNDLHGHAEGDVALQAVARALETALREVDALGRMGGEEFYALLPSGDETAAAGAAQRLLERVRQIPPLVSRAGGPPTALTISIGIAVADDRREPRHELLRRLDAALYRAKDEGRDRAVSAKPPVSALRLAAD